ncbi:MAG TPA: diaminopimelate epimerase [Chlamydiales bacterium]|jgi:diaminopimelate epimerase
MSTLCFGKYEGAGNDFILVDDRSLAFDSTRAKALCHRKFGIGADGLVLLQPDSAADFRMRIFNADGTEAEGCGNGLRCLGQFLLDLRLPKKSYRIRVHNRVLELRFLNEGIGVVMGDPKDLSLNLPTQKGPVHFVDTGVPHAVQFVSAVEPLDLNELGPQLRFHPLFGSKGANANFAALQGDGSVRVRTFERGVEGETLACGTGACAVAVIASALHSLPSPIPVHFPGGTLHIFWDGKELLMVGPARKVFEGCQIA